MEKKIPIKGAFLPLDHEEAELMAQDEAGSFVPVSEPEQTEIKRLLQAAAENTLSQKAPLSIRLEKGDIVKVKERAKRLGIPYQTLITSVLHQYAE